MDAFQPWIRQVLRTLLSDTTPQLVNVNFPRDPQGLIWTRVSVRQYAGRIVPTTDPSGREVFWFTVTPIEGAEKGTDRWAIEQRWISMTPLRLDLTDEQQLSEARRQRPLDEALAAVVSPGKSSPEAAESVLEDEASTSITQGVRPVPPDMAERISAEREQ
jgi:hypothetical protein